MKRMTISICLAVALALALLLPQLSMTYTTTQAVIRQADIRPPCPSGIGTGSAFDGTNLWYSCSAHSTDLYRVGLDGAVTHSYRIDGGLGALAYDRGRNGIWAGWGNGTAGTGAVWFISLDASKHLIGASLAGHVSEGIPCDLNDGLVYSGLTGNLYFSTACSKRSIATPSHLVPHRRWVRIYRTSCSKVISIASHCQTDATGGFVRTGERRKIG